MHEITIIYFKYNIFLFSKFSKKTSWIYKCGKSKLQDRLKSLKKLFQLFQIGIPEKLYSGRIVSTLGLWTSGRLDSGHLDSAHLDSGLFDAWTLYNWTLGLCMLRCLHSGRLGSGRLEASTLNAWTLGIWTLGLHVRISRITFIR